MKTKNVVNTYRNSSTKKLRARTLKRVNSSKKYYRWSKRMLARAKKLAKRGEPVVVTLNKANAKYKIAYRVSRNARSWSKKTKKLFLKTQTRSIYWDGPVITKFSGCNNGPTGYETYYNLPMGGCVRLMRNLGFSAKKYPYWVRNDGCKMFGDYIMVGAYLPKYPKGTVLECSRGTCIVCDTGLNLNPDHLDIAVSW